MESVFKVDVLSDKGNKYTVEIIGNEIYPTSKYYTDLDLGMSFLEYDENEIESLTEDEKQLFIDNDNNLVECEELLEDILNEDEKIIAFVSNFMNVKKVSDWEKCYCGDYCEKCQPNKVEREIIGGF